MKVYMIEFTQEVEYCVYTRHYNTVFSCKKLAEMIAESERKTNESYEIIKILG